MSDDKKNTGSPDRDRINVNEDYELQYWTKALMCPQTSSGPQSKLWALPAQRFASTWASNEVPSCPWSNTAASATLIRPRNHATDLGCPMDGSAFAPAGAPEELNAHGQVSPGMFSQPPGMRRNATPPMQRISSGAA